MLNVLRLTDDFGEADYEARTGLEFATLADAVAAAERKGLLQKAGEGRWRVTEIGQRFLNDLQALFLSAGQAVPGQSGVTTAA
jgi:oxygen-independent coproporphyrinogen-3 oxidase